MRWRLEALGPMEVSQLSLKGLRQKVLWAQGEGTTDLGGELKIVVRTQEIKRNLQRVVFLPMHHLNQKGIKKEQTKKTK